LLVEKASIEMFDEPMDDELWQLVALSAGTGNAVRRPGGPEITAVKFECQLIC
jgi:hypothetical protein